MPSGLSIGQLIHMDQNVVYSLPASKCKLYSQTAGVTLQQSNLASFAVLSAVTLVEGAYEVGATFIRCTDALGCDVILKK